MAHHSSFAPEWQTAADDADAVSHRLDTQRREAYDQHAKSLRHLPLGTRVVVQDPRTKLWSTTGTVVAIGAHRDYYVKLPSGRVFWRNRRFLRPLITAVPPDPALPTPTPTPAPTRRSSRRRQRPRRLHISNTSGQSYDWLDIVYCLENKFYHWCVSFFFCIRQCTMVSKGAWCICIRLLKHALPCNASYATPRCFADLDCSVVLALVLWADMNIMKDHWLFSSAWSLVALCEHNNCDSDSTKVATVQQPCRWPKRSSPLQDPRKRLWIFFLLNQPLPAVWALETWWQNSAMSAGAG